jgi:hypothetical protein
MTGDVMDRAGDVKRKILPCFVRTAIAASFYHGEIARNIKDNF